MKTIFIDPKIEICEISDVDIIETSQTFGDDPAGESHSEW